MNIKNIGTKLTEYVVLVPAKTEGLFKFKESVYFETGNYGSRLPEYIKNLLIQNEGYPENIVVKTGKKEY